MSQIMGSKWKDLPAEILEKIVQLVAVGSEKNVKTKGKKPQWAMVNKQWYEWYQFIKYKNITISLDLSDKLLNNIIHSKFSPGKWVKIITFNELSRNRAISHPPLNTDLLYLLMVCCPNVKHVILPEFMDYSYCENEWTYFFTTLVNNNIWKLHSLSVQRLSRPIKDEDARRQYFEYIYHLRSSIKNLH